MRLPPTVAGVQKLTQQLTQGRRVVIPTECTYEVVGQLNWKEPNAWMDRIQGLSAAGCCQPPSVSLCSEDDIRDDVYHESEPSSVPHVLVPPYSKFEASKSLLWKKLFSKRPYAVGSKDGEVIAAYAFNETQRLLRWLTKRLWPGPLIIRVSCNQPETAMKLLTVQRQGRTYITLRSLCHPLAVKIGNEVMEQEAAGRRHSSNLGYCSSSDEGSPPTSPNASPCGSAPLHPLCKANEMKSILLGVPLLTSQGSDAFVTRSTSVCSRGMVVLNGEASTDVFAVPPCSYGKPSDTVLWLDAAKRQVVLQGCDKKTASTVRQVLRIKPPQTDKDRVLQAVLSKWKVVED